MSVNSTTMLYWSDETGNVMNLGDVTMRKNDLVVSTFLKGCALRRCCANLAGIAFLLLALITHQSRGAVGDVVTTIVPQAGWPISFRNGGVDDGRQHEASNDCSAFPVITFVFPAGFAMSRTWHYVNRPLPRSRKKGLGHPAVNRDFISPAAQVLMYRHTRTGIRISLPG